MLVCEIMTSDVSTCRPTDSLARAAQIMWDRDCGVVPVVNDEGMCIGMVTDRDICFAAFFQDELPKNIQVRGAMSESVTSCYEDDSIETAEQLMCKALVRRLPVIDDDGVLRGIISLNDIAMHLRPKPGAHSLGRIPTQVDELGSESIARTLSAIGWHPSSPDHTTSSVSSSRHPNPNSIPSPNPNSALRSSQMNR
jgi:CBS domain-containing protein